MKIFTQTYSRNTINGLDNKRAYFKKELDLLTVKYNRSRIFRRAKYIMKSTSLDWSKSLRQSWAESKAVILKNRIKAQRLKALMLNLFTPKSFKDSEEYKTISMNKVLKLAYSNGTNLNTFKQ